MWVPLLLILFFSPLISAQIRLCEVSGDCRLCPDRRYSYYRCGHPSLPDCHSDEMCDAGFCCPLPKPVLALQTESFPMPPALPTVAHSIDGEIDEKHDDKCPDGSEWQHQCISDKQCPTNTVCAEGKCCNSCRVRRRQILDSLGASEVMGQEIPQCSEDGLTYRPKQCLAGTQLCWCVTSWGRRLAQEDCDQAKESCLVERMGSCPRVRPTSDSSSMTCRCDDDCYGQKKCCSIDGNLVCTTPVIPQGMTMVCGMNEQFSACFTPCQPSCDDPSVPPCPSPICQPGCHCLPGYIRKDSSPRSICIPRATCVLFDVTAHCADDRRQYQGCGSACPISCQNRNNPRCHERCVSGCFCKIPYILENGADPLHSRCVLPAACPMERIPFPTTATAAQEIRTYTNQVQVNLAHQVPYPPTPNVATVVPHTNRCADPLKNYLSCGTKCLVGCNDLKPSTECSLSCVPGCFCHAPYILQDAKNPQSACILPQNCPKTAPTEAVSTTCSDPRKEWTSCGAHNCARSCTNLLGLCGAGYCSPGCICREPYVLQDSHDSNSRCVLPSECQRKCEDPNKEFLTCGSSCPVGCDNRHPRSCTPCMAGCFCRNGLVAMNSSSWQTSECVRLEECSAFTEEPSTSTPTEPPTTQAPLRRELQIDTTMTTLLPLSPDCPVTTLDVGGHTCDHDTDCPSEQKCCRALIASLGVSPQRCTCRDPLAVWSSCGSLCPEYCGQPSVPVCSTTCNPGCQCAAGYVRARNDVAAPCIPREACAQLPTNLEKIGKIQEIMASLDGPKATIREILEDVPQDPFDKMAAVANLRGERVRGRFTFTQFSRTNLKISGSLQGLEPGAHAIVLHQFGDISNDCLRIGPPFLFKRNNNTPSLGDITSLSTGSSEFSRVVDWPVGDVIGRSIAIYRFSTDEWQSKSQFERPIACATIGVAN